jgi:hypothetical protein
MLRYSVSVLSISLLIHGIVAAMANDDLLAPYETGDRKFVRREIGDKIVYFHQRTIGDAIVEKDFIVYQFHKDTKQLLNKKQHWRTGLPEHVASKITKKQAEAMAEGEVDFSQLYIISPESDIFPIEPTPENPCWVVRSTKDSRIIVTIIDAVTGEFLGYGMRPPQQ